MKVVFAMATRAGSGASSTFRSIRAHGWEVETIVIENNDEGLPIVYNRILDERAGRDELLVLLHDDISIWDILAPQKLLHAASVLDFSIIGIAGAASFDISRRGPFGIVWWCGDDQTRRHGFVENELPNGQCIVTVFGPSPAECAVVDGLLMAIDMRRIGGIRFDPQFSWHFYDLDFCLAARKVGLRIGVTNVHLLHLSGGAFNSPGHRAAQDLFVAKHGASGMPVSSDRVCSTEQQPA